LDYFTELSKDTLILLVEIYLQSSTVPGQDFDQFIPGKEVGTSWQDSPFQLDLSIDSNPRPASLANHNVDLY